ncbi:eukaryotic translation initiation factor 5B [Ochlerotatus camptorhynchus]|uniref:eukaryotic translation initiation factor 5B n=1 Tax=Ochlerotatus camptorhynchus TaxID=644619 RepID=UPI0031D2EFD3
MDPEKRDCLMCNAPNKICDMVQCDKCELWAHYSCTGVTDEVKEQDWRCIKCNNALQVPKTRKISKAEAKKTIGQKSRSDGGSSVGSVSESGENLEDSLKKLEDEKRTQEKALEDEMILREKRLEMTRALQEKRRQMEKAFREKQLQQDRELKERQLQEEHEMLEKELSEEASFQDRRKKMYEEFVEAKMTVAKPVAGREKVKFWLKKQTGGKNSPLTTTKLVEPVAGSSKNKAVTLEEEAGSDEDEDEGSEEGEHEDEGEGEDEDVEEGEDEDKEGDEESEDEDEEFQISREEHEFLSRLLTDKKRQPSTKKLQQFTEKQQPSLKKQLPTKKNQKIQQQKTSQWHVQTNIKLSKEQIAARQALSKNPPIFKGEPELWPIFISSYE